MVSKGVEAIDPTKATMRGTNQSGVRVHNERLVLSILRRDGAMAKAEISRLTGLSAQTASVIMRALEMDGMILRDAPRRGKVGQPSVPMRLNPDAAFFHGVAVGRRWMEHVLVDMVGRVRAIERTPYDWPEFDAVLDFVTNSIDALELTLDPEVRDRIQGLGVAIPAHIWDWKDEQLAPRDQRLAWRDRDYAAELDARVKYDVQVQNDSAAACAAELVFGLQETMPETFLHIFIGYSVGGGLVIDNHLFTGPTGSAGAIGTMPVAQPDGSTRLLYDVASLLALAQRIVDGGKDIEKLMVLPLDWSSVEDEIEDWLDEAIPALSQAVLAATSLIDVQAVLIDGYMPSGVRSRIVQGVARHIDTADFSGLVRPEIRAGTVGPVARSMGAASLPLAARFLV